MESMFSLSETIIFMFLSEGNFRTFGALDEKDCNGNLDDKIDVVK
jgi:hypothetical protein